MHLLAAKLLGGARVHHVTGVEDDEAVGKPQREIRPPRRGSSQLLAVIEQAPRTAGPLLLRIDKHGRIAAPMTRAGCPIGDAEGRMTAEAVADGVARIVAAAELEGRWTGHSLRRGFATAARRICANLERIGRHGGWADGSALLGSWRRATAGPTTR
ncbi:hypothetical protein GCM10022226_46760 [Sphaerisporangium flaviroseum]|uniref:Tyr recombinase domain-containing protein n=1 Tax=Sphaerisporangium flaviroseum TaxID=509199 RepID=A0ABP7IL64_9ACTN